MMTLRTKAELTSGVDFNRLSSASSCGSVGYIGQRNRVCVPKVESKDPNYGMMGLGDSYRLANGLAM